MPRQILVRVLVMEDGDLWVARGLDYDIAAHGATATEAQKAFVAHFTARLQYDRDRGAEPLEGVPSAPPEFWESYIQLTRPCGALAAERIDGNENDWIPAFMIPAIQHDRHPS